MSWLVRNRRRIGAVAACYWGAMFVATHVPLPEKALPENSDKLAHFGAYLLLGACLGAWAAASRPLGWKRAAGLLGVTAAYAVVDELLQIPVGRYADWRDGAADIAGAITGLVLIAGLQWTGRIGRRAADPSEHTASDSGDRASRS